MHASAVPGRNVAGVAALLGAVLLLAMFTAPPGHARPPPVAHRAHVLAAARDGATDNAKGVAAVGRGTPAPTEHPDAPAAAAPPMKHAYPTLKPPKGFSAAAAAQGRAAAAANTLNKTRKPTAKPKPGPAVAMATPAAIASAVQVTPELLRKRPKVGVAGVRRLLSVPIVPERITHVPGALDIMMALRQQLQAELLLPAMYCNALRPHGYVDQDGFRSVPLDRLFTLTTDPPNAFMDWPTWIRRLRQHPACVVNALAIDYNYCCAQRGGAALYYPATPEVARYIPSCTRNACM